MPLCRVPKQRHSAKYIFAECQKKALDKDVFCRVPKNNTRQNTSLPSARKKTLGKDVFCRVSKNSTRQNTSLPSVRKKTLGKDVFCRVFLFAECIFLALGKHGLCRVPDKIHSAKTPALGKSSVSGSASCMLLV